MTRVRFALTSALAVSTCALFVALAGAEEVQEMQEFREAFPRATQGCFLRVYGSAHLKANPQQSVAAIRLARLKRETAREALDGPEAPGFAFTLQVRSTSGAAAAEPLDCEAVYEDMDKRTPTSLPSYLRCRSTCNRGLIDVTPLGPDRVRLSLGGQAMGRFVPDAIGVGRTCASDAGVVWLGDREGDRSFILDRASLEACR